MNPTPVFSGILRVTPLRNWQYWLVEPYIPLAKKTCQVQSKFKTMASSSIRLIPLSADWYSRTTLRDGERSSGSLQAPRVRSRRFDGVDTTCALRLAVLGNRHGRELWREFLILALGLLPAEQ